MQEYRIDKKLIPLGSGAIKIEITVQKKSEPLGGYAHWNDEVHFIAYVQPPGSIAKWLGDTFENKCESILKNLISQAEKYINNKTDGQRIAEKLKEKYT